jgi:hypothetical protein
MGDGRQQPENGKGLGFEASARSERRFKTRSRRTDSRGAPRLAPYRVVLLAHSCGFALAAFRGRGTGDGAGRNGNQRLRFCQQQLALLVAVLIAPLETGLIGFAWLKTLRGLEGLDKKAHRRVGRDIVIRQPAKLVGLGKDFDGFLGQHTVAVDQHDARLRTHDERSASRRPEPDQPAPAGSAVAIALGQGPGFSHGWPLSADAFEEQNLLSGPARRSLRRPFPPNRLS